MIDPVATGATTLGYDGPRPSLALVQPPVMRWFDGHAATVLCAAHIGSYS